MFSLRVNLILLLAGFFCLSLTSNASGATGSRHHGKGKVPKSSAAREELPISGQRSRINRSRPTRPNPHVHGERKVEPTIEERGEAFFDRGGVKNSDIIGDHYWIQEKFFEQALSESHGEMYQEYPQGYTLQMLRERFMQKVFLYHHNETLVKGVERYKRDHDLEMTIEEYDMARKHFLNQKPPEGDTVQERQNISVLKGYYRRQLSNPYAKKERILQKMAERNWTLEDIKPYTFPSVESLRKWINELRASGGQPNQAVPSTQHVAIPLGRSNREIDFDLNASENRAKEDCDPALDLQLYDLNIDEGEAHDAYQDEDDDADVSVYDTRYHNPFPGAYQGKFYRAYPGIYESLNDEEDSEE